MATFAPSRARASEIARPMRRAAPVTSAFLPSSLLSPTAMLQGSEQIVYGLRKREVLLRQATGGVRGEIEAYVVVGDEDVGMVIVLLRDVGDSLHKRQRATEILEFENPQDDVTIEFPI